MLSNYIDKIKQYLPGLKHNKVYIKRFQQHSSTKIPLFQIEVQHKKIKKSYTLSAKQLKNNPLLFQKLTLEEKIEIAYFAGVQHILEENLEITTL